ncbi:MAG TPA: phosphatidate cytidylyltransferase [Ignavibacteriales bacterium]|nr:phosphatidate cytidylyltransferase [Ignavibacteriales bacterium]
MAGNNTLARILVSIVAIPLIIAVCYFGGLYFAAFVFLIGMLSLYEIAGLAEKKSSFVNKGLAYFSAAFLIANAYYYYVDMSVALISLFVTLLVLELFRNKESAILNIGGTLLGIFYIGLFSSSIIMLREFYQDDYRQGGFLIIAILISIWVCDSAAFFLGVRFGKHKLFPRVSPKKSWEGAVAGFVFAVLTIILLKYFALDFLTWTDAVMIGLIIGVIGQLGDLTESLLKRDAQIKDSSNLIPGHGGIFDRFDSFYMSAPVIYVYLYLTYIN